MYQIVLYSPLPLEALEKQLWVKLKNIGEYLSKFAHNATWGYP